MTDVFTFDVDAFRLLYPAFANDTVYPDEILQAYWDTAILYISDRNCGWLEGDSRLRSLNLMTAHLTQISTLIAAGKTIQLVQAATIDKITVTLKMPPVETEFRWWLNLTPYGQQLLVLLGITSVGGFYVGGSCSRQGFRGPTGGLY